jgi:menaquinone-9 beta-reductase
VIVAPPSWRPNRGRDARQTAGEDAGVTENMFDLIIIGGGPGGTSAAITAARSHARVLLLERGRFPRHKVCGEFVSSESLGLLTKLLASQDGRILQDAIRIPQGRVFIDGRVLQAPVQPAAASIARLDLDKALWDAAHCCGVDARQQVAVQNVDGSGPFLVHSSDGQFEARAVINASGRWSNFTPPKAHGDKKWIGLKGHFAESFPSASVDLYFFAGGYCGVQPVGLSGDCSVTRINACAMVRADVVSTLPEVLRQHPALRERSAQWQPLSDPVSVAPLLFGKPQPLRDGVLMAGDAAGFVDPFVGDGISLALRSGALAAECLASFFTRAISLEAAAGRYEQQYQKQLAPVFRSSSRIRSMLRWPWPVRAPIVSLLSNSQMAMSYFVRNTR